MKNRLNKKGELTTQQIVGLIILITSFTVIIFLIFRLDFGRISDKEICHNSVAMRGQSQLVSGPLDCKTNYVCISGGGKCEGFSKGETKKIDLDKDNALNEIMKAIAEEMADCWWMFGEGKVDYIGFDAGGKIKGNLACSLCSRIAFDETINEKLQSVTYEEFYNYLGQTKKEETKTYLFYLYGTREVNKVEELLKIDFKEPIEFNKEFSIVTGIGDVGVIKSTWNLVAEDTDTINRFFGFEKIFGEAWKFKKYVNVPVTLKEKSKLNELECGEFITKA